MSRSHIEASIREGIALQQATLETLVPSISVAAYLLANVLGRGNKVLVMGNGGSAAEAQHFVAELVGRFEQERSAYAAIALATDTSVLTALVNDYGVKQMFSRQIEALGQFGDLVVGFSTSGNSLNVVEGAKTSQKKGLTVLGLTGETGGELANYCNLILRVPSRHTARIQEVHTLISHVLCESTEQYLLSASQSTDAAVLNNMHSAIPMVATIDDRLRRIKLLILDFDGVLTDNRVLVTQDKTEGVFCHRGDGWGIARLRELGLEIVVLSTEPNPVVQARCDKLNITCIHGCDDKPAALHNLAQARSLSLEEIGYVGNDVNDLGCMQQVGVPIAVADAVPEIKATACFVTAQPGGYGAVREVADRLIAAMTRV
ncbi:MAG: SIS domain-containing protein [Cyanobacteria bacterium P01_B01_bin.77]